MTETRPDLSRIVDRMRAPIEQYAGLVRDVAGDNLHSLTVFGAIAAGAFDINRHTARSVLVLNRMDLGFLRQLAEHGTRLGKAHIAAPLVMTPDYIRASADTFPLELIEIQQNHLVLVGEDDFKDLSFEDAHVRLQCERELKTILIGLRQGLLGAAGQQKLIGAIEVDLAERLIRTLRGLLWLKGQKDGKPATKVVAEVESMTERKFPGVRVAISASATRDWNEFEVFYKEVEALGAWADAW